MSCPITQDTFVDPIMVPCCGQSFERSAIIEWLNSSWTCPLCKESLTQFDPINAVTNRGLVPNAAMVPNAVPAVAQYKAQTVNMGEFNVTKVTYLNSVRDNSFLNIIIADESGSMSGSRWNAVIKGIKHMHALYPHNNMYISYSSAAYVRTYNEIISNFSGGGTSFYAAFSLLNDETKVKIPDEVNTINIVFMTDGEDQVCSSTVASINSFTKRHGDMGRKVVFNSVGISKDHHVDPLDSIRKLGTELGIYCYADTSESGSEDIYNKLSQLSQVSMTTNKTVSVIGFDNECEITLGDLVLSNSVPKVLLINGAEEVIVEDGPYDDFKNELYSKVIVELSRAATNVSLPVCRGIIERYLQMFEGLSEDSPLIAPIEMIKSILAGKTIDAKNLLDLSSGIYTSRVTKSTEHNATMKGSSGTVKLSSGINVYDQMYQGKRVAQKITRIYFTKKDRNVPAQLIDAASGCLSGGFDGNITDTYGNNALHFLCMAGRDKYIMNIMNMTNPDELNKPNNFGYSPFMLAATRGHWRTVDAIINVVTNKQELIDCLVYCANIGFTQSANIIYARYQELSGEPIASCEFVGCGYTWYINNYQSTATEVTMKDVIRSGNPKLLSKITDKITWHHFHEVIDNEELFLEMMKIVDKSMFEEYDPAKTGDLGSPLIFLTISKNKKRLFDALLERGINVDSINHKKNTPLYHATYKGSIDMFCALLDSGADVQHINGDKENILMPACQYNHTEIVDLLLEHDVDPNIRNYRGETPISSSVRMGRNDVIKILLRSKKVTIETILTKTKIDGFDCVLSCLEQDRPETLKLLHDYFIESQCEEMFWNDACLDDNFLYPRASIWHVIAKYNAVKSFKYLVGTPGFNAQDLYVHDLEHQTALHIAVLYDNYGILHAFNDHHVDWTVVNAEGKTPKSMAILGSKAYNLFFDPLASQLFGVTRAESVDTVIELMNNLRLTIKVFGNVIARCRNNEEETWLHVAARTDNGYLYEKIKDLFDNSLLDSRGLSPKFWLSIHSGDETVKEIKELFKGSLMLLFKVRTNIAGIAPQTSTETRIVPAQYSGFGSLKGILTNEQLIDLKNYIIIGLTKSHKMDTKYLILSWFIDNSFKVPPEMLQTCKKHTGNFYKVIEGTSTIGVGSELDLGGLVYKSVPCDIDMTNCIIYEFSSPVIYETFTGQYYLPTKNRTVLNMCRADKFAVLQKNIRQTTYALTRGQVTGLLIEVSD